MTTTDIKCERLDVLVTNNRKQVRISLDQDNECWNVTWNANGTSSTRSFPDLEEAVENARAIASN